MKRITKQGLVGSRIVRIHFTSEDLDGLDFTLMYFTTDRGLTFSMPLPGKPWKAVELPPEAEELHDPGDIELTFRTKRFWKGWARQVAPSTSDLVGTIRQRSIKGVLCLKSEQPDFYVPEDVCLLLDDGSGIFCMAGAPHGTGASGLYWEPDIDVWKTDDEDWVDLFTLSTED